jgi:uncharacterized protein
VADPTAPGGAAPLAGGGPLVDVHAHFYHPRSGRTDWEARNQARLRAGDRIGITVHVASILGTWGFTSPTYFPSPADVTLGNDEMLALQRREPDRVVSYVAVNPNDTAHALEEIARCVEAGAVGLKLAASRRLDHRVEQRVVGAASGRGVHPRPHRRRRRLGPHVPGGRGPA